MVYTNAVFHRLERGLHVPLTLILADEPSPALLHRWLEVAPCPWTRQRMTPADNDPERFLGRLGQAVTPFAPGLPAIATLSPLPLVDAMGVIINTLLAAPEDFLLLWEAYEQITAPAIHQAVSLLVEYPPPRLHLYLVSREAPPLPLPRLRVRRQLVELRL